MNLQNSSLYNFLSLTHEGQISFAGQHHSCLLLIVKDSLGFAELSIFGCQNLFDKWTLNSHFQRYQDEKIIKLIKEIISLLNYFTAIIKAKIYLYFVFHSATINELMFLEFMPLLRLDIPKDCQYRLILSLHLRN